MGNNNIKSIYYVKGDLKLISPMIIACGDDEIADLQIIRDWDGNIFIPGTSIAGVLRQHLEDYLKDKDSISELFGSSEKNSGHSLFTFYDANAISVSTDIRDGIKIDNLTKTAKDKSKYDYEIINKGSKFEFRMEIISRKETDESFLEAFIGKSIEILKSGNFRIGAKTKRGFGKVKLINTNIVKYNLDNEKDREKWINFKWADVINKIPLNKNNILFKDSNIVKISAKFLIEDSLIIRAYSTNPDDVDSVSLTSNGKPVISGTSWNGAIRHALENIGYEIDRFKQMESLLRKVFGYVDDEDRAKNAIPSKVIIEESEIKKCKMIKYTRNKIDRFTGGVVNSALFDEKPIYGGKVELKCEIHNPEDYEIGMLLLAIKELENGIQTVGGGSNIGRGMLKKEQPYKVEGINIKDEGYYFNKLAEKLNSVGDK